MFFGVGMKPMILVSNFALLLQMLLEIVGSWLRRKLLTKESPIAARAVNVVKSAIVLSPPHLSAR